MGASQALAIERLLAEGIARKPGGALLSGLGARLRRASELPPPGATSALPTAITALDRLLPGGLPKGRLVELSGRRSSGRFSLGLAALAAATSSGLAAALVDLGDHLDPEAAERAGVDLRCLLWARPRRAKQALAAAEMLVAAGFPLVVADLGLSPRTRWVPDAAWVRLARSAAAQGATLLLSTPWRASGIAADAVVSSAGARAIWRGSGASPRLLAGLSSRLTLERYGRSTPGASGMVCLTSAETIGDGSLVANAGGREGRPYDDGGDSSRSRSSDVGAGLVPARGAIPSPPSAGERVGERGSAGGEGIDETDSPVIPSFVADDFTASAQGLPSPGLQLELNGSSGAEVRAPSSKTSSGRPADGSARDDPRAGGRKGRPDDDARPRSDELHGAGPGSFSTIRTPPA